MEFNKTIGKCKIVDNHKIADNFMINHKTKTHTKKEWEKVDERLQKNKNVKYVKNKRRKSRKNNNNTIN